MVIKWTSERNERLLLLIIKDVKVDAAKLAKAWDEQYGSDGFKPTPRAITEHVGLLKRNAGVKGDAAKTPNGSSTPKTPRTTTKPTPTTKGKSTKSPAGITPSKRKKSVMSDDEEVSILKDSDASEVDLKDLPKAISRASLARTKKVPTRYKESESEVEKADDESDFVVKAESNGGVKDDDGDEVHVSRPKPAAEIDSVMGDVRPAKKRSPKKARRVEDDSDVSDFEKTRV